MKVARISLHDLQKDVDQVHSHFLCAGILDDDTGDLLDRRQPKKHLIYTVFAQ